MERDLQCLVVSIVQNDQFSNTQIINIFCLVNMNDITEVRCGQQTRNFNLFPYVEVDKQSFSLIFEKENGLET